MDLKCSLMNNTLIPMFCVDQLTLITDEHQPFKTLISDVPFLYFFLFLLPLLFFSFSLHSTDLFRQVTRHLFHNPMMLRLKMVAIEFVITLVDLFRHHLLHKKRMLCYYHISSLKGLVGQLANEFVFLLVEASERAPGMMTNDLQQLIIIRSFQEEIIGRLYPIQLRLLWLEIEVDAQRNSAENEDEDGGESSNYRNGKDCLYRLAFELGHDTIAPVAFQQLPVCLTSPRWEERLAGLVALSQINLFWETIPDDISEQVVTVALDFFQHHPYPPRVRLAAINAIDDLFRTSNWGFQSQCYRRVLPALAGAIYDPEQRVDSVAFNAARYMYQHFDGSLPLSWYLRDSTWQKRLFGLVRIAQIAKLRPRVEIPNLEKLVTRVLNSFKYDPDHPGVRWATIDAIRELSNYVGPTFQVMFQDCVLETLRSALDDVQAIQNDFDHLLLDLIQDSHRPVRLATINATLQLANGLDRNLPLPLPFHSYVLSALSEAMRAFQYPGVQDDAAFAMINISTNYPLDTPPYLRVIVASLLEVRRREDIALDQTRICEIRNFLEMLEARLPHETLTSTLDGLSTEQQVEFSAILLNYETYGE